MKDEEKKERKTHHFLFAGRNDTITGGSKVLKKKLVKVRGNELNGNRNAKVREGVGNGKQRTYENETRKAKGW
jgi:hypothetical protein